MDPIHIRILNSADAPIYRILRLQALNDSPASFLTTVDEYAKRSIEEIADQLTPTEEKFTLGAFTSSEELVGMVTFLRASAAKLRHRGSVLGMFVAAKSRRNGIAHQLLETLIEKARQLVGLEQLQLAVVTSNTGAMKLYETLGFRTFAIDKKANKVGTQYWDEAHMVLPLASEAVSMQPMSTVAEPMQTHGITNVNHVTINVSNLSRSIDFYVHTLGLTVVHQGRLDAYLAGGYAWVCLQERVGLEQSSAHLGVDHVAFSISTHEFDTAVDRLRAADVTIVRGPMYRGGGLTASFHDIDGTQLELFTGTLAERMKVWK